jgi:hypothetical protein
LALAARLSAADEVAELAVVVESAMVVLAVSTVEGSAVQRPIPLP